MSKGTGQRGHDARFTAWHQQPRVQKLTKRTREIAQADAAFAQALRQRTEPARIDALVSGRGQYWSEKPCDRCGGPYRRVYDRACWACWQAKHRPAEQWEAIRAGTGWRGGERTREGRQAFLQWQREQKAAGVVQYEHGPWVALRHPDQHTELRNVETGEYVVHLQQAFDANPRMWHARIEADGDLLHIINVDLGW